MMCGLWRWWTVDDRWLEELDTVPCDKGLLPLCIRTRSLLKPRGCLFKSRMFVSIKEKWGNKIQKRNVWFGDAGYRSPYLSHAKRALYHLSYIPMLCWIDYHLFINNIFCIRLKAYVGVLGWSSLFELKELGWNRLLEIDDFSISYFNCKVTVIWPIQGIS